jgi:2-polyprenyl-3-methyl-5-hydroxy-6-metoxy-1,4-benzoquinol methylase
MTYRYILDLIDCGLIHKGKALDLGCGPGASSTLLSSLGFDVEAVDLSDQIISAANDGGKIIFLKSDVRNFDIKEKTYDFIHSRNMLHFLSKDDMSLVISRMYSGLKTGGVMWFNVSGDQDGWKDKSKHVTFLTEEELCNYVESPIKESSPFHSKTTWLGSGTTMKGVRKFIHTISYIVVKK